VNGADLKRVLPEDKLDDVTKYFKRSDAYAHFDEYR
jgi:hypothetical protein